MACCTTAPSNRIVPYPLTQQQQQPAMSSSSAPTGAGTGTPPRRLSLSTGAGTGPLSRDQWVPDAGAPECSTCAQTFTRVFRRHHCRQCGRVVCGLCSPNRAAVDGYGDKPARVCCECWCERERRERGVGEHELLALLRQAVEPANRSTVAKANLLHDMAVIEEEIAEGERLWTERMRETAELHEAEDATSLHLSPAEQQQRRETREAAEDVAREERTYKFNLIGQQAAGIHDKLSEWRTSSGTAMTVVKYEKDMREIHPWLVRVLLVTPATARTTAASAPSPSTAAVPPHLLALSSFIYPNPSVESPHPSRFSHKQLRWHTLRTIDQLASLRPSTMKVSGVSYKALTLCFQPQQSAQVANGAKDTLAAANLNVGQVLMKKVSGKDESDENITLLFVDPANQASLDAVHSYFFAAASGNVEGDTPLEKTVDDERADEMEKMWQWDSQAELQHTLRLHMKHHQDKTKQLLQLLHAYHTDMRTPVQWTEAQHAEQLTRLYSLFAPPSSPFPGTKGEAWKALGFQGEDPTTDFRGMGLLSVHMLVYMGERHHDMARRLVDVVSVRPYPLCAAGVNVVSMLCDLLGLTGKELPFTTTAHSIAPTGVLFSLPLCRVLLRTNVPLVPVTEDTLQPVGELFCCLLSVLDAMTVRLAVNYLQFGEVIRALRERVVELAGQEVVGVNAMVRRLHEMEEEAAATTKPASATNGASVSLASVTSSDGRAVSPVSEEGEDGEDERLAREDRQRAADSAQSVLDQEDMAQHKLAAAVLAHAHDAGEEGVEEMERHEASSDDVHVEDESVVAPTVVVSTTEQAVMPVNSYEPAQTPKIVVFHEG